MKRFRFFLIGGILLPLLIMLIYPVYSMDYLEFYNNYVVRTEPVEPYSIVDTVYYGGANKTYFISHSDLSCVREYYDDSGNYLGCDVSYSPSGILYYVDDLPLVFFKLKVIEENLPRYNASNDIESAYAVLSMTHYHDMNDILVMYVLVGPEAEAEDYEYVDIWWGRILFNLTSGEVERKVIEGSATRILLSPQTLYSNYLEITIVPAVYTDIVSVNEENMTRAIFGFYNVYKIGDTKHANFSVAWRTVYFDQHNITRFRMFMDMFRRWWVWIGQGYFIKTNEMEIIYSQYVFNFDPSSTGYCEIEYSDVFVYSAIVDTVKYYNDWVLGRLPRYNYTALIDLRDTVISTSIISDEIFKNAGVYVCVFAAVAMLFTRYRIPYLGVIAAIVCAGILSYMNNNVAYIVVAFIGSIPVISTLWSGGEDID